MAWQVLKKVEPSREGSSRRAAWVAGRTDEHVGASSEGSDGAGRTQWGEAEA